MAALLPYGQAMARPVLLNNIDHQHLRLVTGFGETYGDAVNQTTVFPTEFEALQREYPILFRRNEAGLFRSIVLLGIDPQENLFLAGDRWDATYVPALHMRGPFSIGTPSGDASGEPMLHVDLDHPRLAADGMPIFREQGGNSPFLERAIGALQSVYLGSQMSERMFPLFGELDLLAPVTLQLDLDTTRRVNIPDCFTIDMNRFRDLDGVALERLHREDLLRPAIWVASSLGNVQALLDRKLRRDRPL
jgi:hypothetical protein